MQTCSLYKLKLIADYPGNVLPIGSIIDFDDDKDKWEFLGKRYPKIYQRALWHHGITDLSILPKYLKNVVNGQIQNVYYVDEYFISDEKNFERTNQICFKSKKVYADGSFERQIDFLYPATEEEYLEYKQKLIKQ